MTALPPLLLIGGGKMGAAMLAGWRERGVSHVMVVDPGASAAALQAAGVTVLPTAADLPADFAPHAVILAVKPQVAAEALAPLARYAGSAVFISIMAGKTIGWLADRLGSGTAVVRAMPNTPAAIRQGITVACAGPQVLPAQRDLAETLLAAVGQIAFVADEALLDPVTAISGGGPAYVFLLVELLESAAIDHGIEPDLARRLARQTIIGSALLLAASDEPATTLRHNVTSPKGTTERALAVLMEAWPASMAAAIGAATARSRELGEG